MRAKFINEKFVEISDPIKDLGIGKNALEKFLREKLIEFRNDVLSSSNLTTYEEVGFSNALDIIINHKFDTKSAIESIDRSIRERKLTIDSHYDDKRHINKINEIIDGYEMILSFLEDFQKEYIK
jgi:hypothetical protein